MDLGISGHAALLLGSTQGLGLACARALAAEGVKVAVNGRNPDRTAAVAAELGGVGITGDISDPAERPRIVTAARDALGPLTILVTNAGGPPPGPVEDHDHDTWLRALETNMLAALECVRLTLPDMKEARFGRIVNVTSFTVREPYPNMGLATAVRAGLTGAMKSLSHEVAPLGITVNNLLPGLMDTGALERVYKAQSKTHGISEDEAKARMAESVPMKRLGTAEDFGPACAFLCSRLASYMTGQNITVDGGIVRSLT